MVVPVFASLMWGVLHSESWILLPRLPEEENSLCLQLRMICGNASFGHVDHGTLIGNVLVSLKGQFGLR